MAAGPELPPDSPPVSRILVLTAVGRRGRADLVRSLAAENRKYECQLRQGHVN